MKIIIPDHDSLNDVPYITVWTCLNEDNYTRSF